MFRKKNFLWKTLVGLTFTSRARRDFSKTLQKVAIENRVENEYNNGKDEDFHALGNVSHETLVIKLECFQRRIQDLNFMGLAFKVLIIELVVLLKIRGSYTLLFAILVDFYT